MNAAVLGSGFAGLSAAEKALENYGKVVLYSSSEKKISEPENGYGEFLASLLETPISKSDEGVLRKVEELEWLSNEMTKNLKLNDSYVIDRSIVQANWTKRLKGDELQTNLEEEINAEEFNEICESFDLVIDASGPEPISEEFLNISVNEQYSLESISTRQLKDFDDHPVTAPGSFMKGFHWINIRNEDQATVGAVSTDYLNWMKSKNRSSKNLVGTESQ